MEIENVTSDGVTSRAPRTRTRTSGQYTLRTAPSWTIIDRMSENLKHGAIDGPNGTDLAMMRLALREARRAAERGEVPVGAIVARGAEVISSAHNEREATNDPTAHAELLALRRASSVLDGWRLTGCTLYATLEPCPMCAGALHAARISRLVYAAPDPKAGAAGTLYDLPSDPRLNHTFPTRQGLLEAEAASLLRDFFRERRNRHGQPSIYPE